MFDFFYSKFSLKLYCFFSFQYFIGSFFSLFFGAWSAYLTSLFLFMFFDIFTGLLVACWKKNSNKTSSGTLKSCVFFKGICKKFYILILVSISYRLDLILNTDYIKNGVVFSFCVSEILSIIENAGLLGVKVPAFLKNCIDDLKNDDDV